MKFRPDSGVTASRYQSMDPSTESASPEIVLQRMPQQMEATGRRDDWTGVTDSVTRRRLQNRHAQRVWSQCFSGTSCIAVTNDTCNTGKKKQQQQQTLTHTPSNTRNKIQHDYPPNMEIIHITKLQAANYIPGRICHNMLPGAQARLDLYARRAYTEYMLHSPRPSALHTVVQLNVLHALMQNASALQITGPALCSLDSVSPFNHVGPTHPAFDTALPPSLQPTALQRSTKHRPWIDLFPLPELRDALLSVRYTALENDIGTDLLDVEEADGLKPNLVVWGDAADPKAWEATVQFLRKWGWLVRGCRELLESTNSWRERRGDRRLVFEVK